MDVSSTAVATEPKTHHYRPEIDGLRAVAVVPVILFHAGFEAFRGGYVGVDIFFVISGYLIGGILLREIRAGTFSIAKFYERRARRILPALFVMQLACLPFAWLWLNAEELKLFSKSLVATQTFSSNVLYYLTIDYFNYDSETNPLLHTWSLGVEEQFYIIFPLALFLIWRWSANHLKTILVVLTALSFLTAQALVGWEPFANFYLLPSRAWELLAGVVLAAWELRDRRPAVGKSLREVLASIGLLLIVVAILTFDSATPIPAFPALLPVGGAVLIIMAASTDTLVGRALALRPMVGIGLISYSLYLWHQPMFAFGRYRQVVPLGTIEIGLLIAAVFAISYASWRFVEAPLRDRDRFPRRQILGISVAGTAMLIAVGLIGYVGKGFPARIEGRDFPDARMMASPANGGCHGVRIPAFTPTQLVRPACQLGTRSFQREALLFGDSFAGQYDPFWNRVGQHLGISVDSVSSTLCAPSIGRLFPDEQTAKARQQCFTNRDWLRTAIGNYPILIFSGHWASMQDHGEMDDAKRLIALASTKADLVILMSAPVSFDVAMADAFERARRFNVSLSVDKLPKQADVPMRAAQQQIATFAARYPNVIVISRDDMFSVDGKLSAVTPDGYPFIFDKGHLSIHGSTEAAKIFLRSPTSNRLRSWRNGLKSRQASATAVQ